MKTGRLLATKEEKQAANEYAAYVIEQELQKDKYTDVEELEDTIVDSFLAGCVWRRSQEAVERVDEKRIVLDEWSLVILPDEVKPI